MNNTVEMGLRSVLELILVSLEQGKIENAAAILKSLISQLNAKEGEA